MGITLPQSRGLVQTNHDHVEQWDKHEQQGYFSLHLFSCVPCAIHLSEDNEWKKDGKGEGCKGIGGFIVEI